MAAELESGNQELDALFASSDYILVMAATGDLEVTPITGRYALNGRYLDALLASVLHTYEGQCAVLVAVRPMRATAQAVHSSMGHPDQLLLALDRDMLRRAQQRLAKMEVEG